jgi:alkylated DNA repair dioxygenase AlkB
MLETLPLADATLRLDPSWLAPAQADRLFDALRSDIDWEVHRIRLFGRLVDSPRLSSWIGDGDASYVYSGVRFRPHPWPSVLALLRDQASEIAGERFNSVLANLYRDGRDAMGWHSDDERELGAQPVIASISLGSARRFVFKHRRQPEQKLALELAHGSLLLMSGATQSNYRHCLPRTAKPIGPRINLTFRRILAGRADSFLA